MSPHATREAPTMIVEEDKPKGKARRPKIVIDWERVQKLAHIQCTQAETATAVGVSVDTLHRHPEFADAHKGGLKGQKEHSADAI